MLLAKILHANTCLAPTTHRAIIVMFTVVVVVSRVLQRKAIALPMPMAVMR